MPKVKGELDVSRKAGTDPFLEDEAIDDDVDVVPLVLVQLGKLGDEGHLPVHAHPLEAGPADSLELFLLPPLLVADHGGKEHHLRAHGVLEDEVGHRDGSLGDDGDAVLGAVGDADPRVEEAEEVVDFRDRAHRGTGVMGCRLLVDRYCRGKPFDGVDVGLLHPPKELAGVGGKGLHVPSLAFRVDGVEGEGALPGAGKPGEDGQGFLGNRKGDVLQVVLPCARDKDVLAAILFHCPEIIAGRQPIFRRLAQEEKSVAQETGYRPGAALPWAR